MKFFSNRRATTGVALVSLILLILTYSLHAAKWLQAVILVIFLASAFAFTFSTEWQRFKQRTETEEENSSK
ncbi:hypothetical protein [Limosilactobacillus kribbianus]|uniref:hypothetical protein n=1 Tax=Limosilactobacillus kribbianus TaxID=2982695 RepID=UPI002263BC83|nr:hypothetical protein [Limosilactobacillus kribbianus]